jgi:hypothetical protein
MVSDWEFPLDDIDPETLGSGYNNVSSPGMFLVEIVGVEDKDPVLNDDGEQIKNGQYVVDYQVIHGKPESEVGKSLRDYIIRTEKALERALKWGHACGLLTKEELAEAKEKGNPGKLSPADAEGRKIVVEVEEDEYKGKTKHRIAFGFHALDSEEAKGIGVGEPGGIGVEDGESAEEENPFG